MQTRPGLRCGHRVRLTRPSSELGGSSNEPLAEARGSKTAVFRSLEPRPLGSGCFASGKEWISVAVTSIPLADAHGSKTAVFRSLEPRPLGSGCFASGKEWISVAVAGIPLADARGSKTAVFRSLEPRLLGSGWLWPNRHRFALSFDHVPDRRLEKAACPCGLEPCCRYSFRGSREQHAEMLHPETHPRRLR